MTKSFSELCAETEVMKTVKVSGFVKKPGIYTFVEGKRLVDMIEMAGGLTQEADLRGIVLKEQICKANRLNLPTKTTNVTSNLIEGRMASAYKPSEGDQKSKMDMLEMLKSR